MHIALVIHIRMNWWRAAQMKIVIAVRYNRENDNQIHPILVPEGPCQHLGEGAFEAFSLLTAPTTGGDFQL